MSSLGMVRYFSVQGLRTQHENNPERENRTYSSTGRKRSQAGGGKGRPTFTFHSLWKKGSAGVLTGTIRLSNEPPVFGRCATWFIDTRAELAACARHLCGFSSSYGSDCKHEAGSVLHALVTATVFESAGCDIFLLRAPPARPEGGPGGGTSTWIACSAVGWSLADLTHS